MPRWRPQLYYCDPEDVAINTVFMIIIVITGIIFMTVNCFYVLDLLQKANQQDLNWLIFYVTYGLVVGMLSYIYAH